MTYVIKPFILPSDLKGISNGHIPVGLLSPVGPSGLLHHNVARAWRAMCSEARNRGFLLTYTFGGTYRDVEDQELLFYSRKSVGGRFGNCKLYKGQTYCDKKPNLADCATPETSNHGWAAAIDTALDMDEKDGANPEDAESIGPALPLMQELAPKYGFSWETLKELWHLRYVLGDDVTDAVLQYEYLINPPTPVEEDDDMNFLYRDRRFNNVFSVGDQAITVGPGIFNAMQAKNAPYIQDVHDQSLIAYMRSSKLTKTQMIPSNEPNLPEFVFPSDLL